MIFEKDSIFHNKTGTVIESIHSMELYRILFDQPPKNKSATPVASNWFNERDIRALDEIA